MYTKERMMKEMIQIMTMINPKILILPDIHGRKFYCKAFARYREIDKDIKRDALKVFEAI